MSTGSPATFRHCLFAGNTAGRKGGALRCVSESPATLEGCTFYGNHSDENGSAIYATSDAEATLSHCIIAFGGPGLPLDSPGIPSVSCTDVYGNAGGDWIGPLMGMGSLFGNLSADPLFCHPEADDYTLAADSPCLDAPGCGQIGAFGQGCGLSTSVPEEKSLPTSWGVAKHEFERSP